MSAQGSHRVDDQLDYAVKINVESSAFAFRGVRPSARPSWGDLLDACRFSTLWALCLGKVGLRCATPSGPPPPAPCPAELNATPRRWVCSGSTGLSGGTWVPCRFSPDETFEATHKAKSTSTTHASLTQTGTGWSLSTLYWFFLCGIESVRNAQGGPKAGKHFSEGTVRNLSHPQRSARVSQPLAYVLGDPAPWDARREPTSFHPHVLGPPGGNPARDPHLPRGNIS